MIQFDCMRCGKCCGPHYVSKQEQEEIDKYLIENNISKREYRNPFDKCPYFENNRCVIYPVRPVVCRLMGVTDLMPCPNNIQPDRKVTIEDAVEIIESVIFR